jgi:N6-adenosine-specific RNA methylase IME4
MPRPVRPIGEILVGKRHRRDLGDIGGLAASIAEVGLLHSIVITPGGKLIAGGRRLAACKELGWVEVPVRIVDLDSLVRGEFAENVHRKDFTLSEAVAIMQALEPLEREAAKERQREGGRRGGEGSGKLPEASKGNAADKAARAAGKARRTLEKAAAVVTAAAADPKFGKLLADMDRTGRAHGPFKRLRAIQQGDAIRAEPPPLPGSGPYRVAVVDPPWPYELRDDDPSHRAVRPYPTMSIDQICALPVGRIMHADAILWIWIPNFEIVHGAHLEILKAWGGFEPKTLLTWAKDRMAHGDWLRAKTEHAIMAVRGRPVVTLANQTTLLHAPLRGHSVKPREFYDLVESLCPAPRYADLFSRYRHNDKWDCHGDEAPAAANVEAAE